MVGIYGIIREFSRGKSLETVDATGFLPVASIPFRYYGDPAGIRTPDPLLKRQLLCRLSYRVKVLCDPQNGGVFLAGTAGLEPADEGVKVPCLTTWLHPCVEKQTRDRDLLPIPHLLVGWVKGLEPSTPGTTIRCSNQLSYTHHIYIRLGSR